MSRFTFVTWAGGGNVPPVVVMAQQLVGRGHAVSVLGSPSLRGRFAAAGLRFDPLSGGDFPMDQTVEADVATIEADVVIVDFMLPRAVAAARSRVAAFVHTLYRPVLSGDFPVVPPELLDRCHRVLVGTIPALDPPGADGAPANAVYVGALVEAADADGWEPPPGDGPLVAVSMGTTPMDEAGTIQRVLDALAGAPVRVVLTIGDHLDAGALSAPHNVSVRRYVPHAALLAHADVFVNHAGLGGIHAALQRGTPMVCVPLGRDQPMNAAAVAALGAGVTVAVDDIDTALAGAVRVVLDDARYAEAARALRGAAATTTRAADELEALATGG
jgi:UDP:flavonoid glycosyltransferase YjiC (YdhE family)